MSFEFPFEAVLNLRESLEAREERTLEQTQNSVAQAQRAIEIASEDLRLITESMGSAAQKRVLAGHLQTMEAQRKALQNKKEELLRTLLECKNRHQQQIQRYQLARRDREVMSEMRDRQLAGYQLDLSRRDQKRLDDIFNSRRK